MNDYEVFNKISENLKNNNIVGYAIVISKEFSTPRGIGAKLVMEKSGKIFGSIGGGPLEALVIMEIKKLLLTGGKKIVEYDLNIKSDKNIGMMCGGKVKIFIEVYGNKEEILLFGGGHVSLAISKLLDFLGLPYQIFDDRSEFASKERFPNATNLLFGKWSDIFSKIDIKPKNYAVITTRCHSQDIECLRYLINKDIPYIGMIASKNKVNEIIAIFKKEKIYLNKKQNFYSPCGLNIGGDSPEYIAISTVSEIIAKINNREGGNLSLNLK